MKILIWAIKKKIINKKLNNLRQINWKIIFKQIYKTNKENKKKSIKQFKEIISLI